MAYTEAVMRRFGILLLLVVGLVAPVLAARGPAYTKGTITALTHSKRARTVAWQSNTPIQTDDDVFELTVQVGTQVYAGEYVPHEEGSAFPEDAWNVGDPVEVRVVKRDIYIKRPSGGELRMYISTRSTAPALAPKVDATPAAPTPATPKK